MTHIRDGTEMELTLIRGRTRDDSERQRRKWQNIIYVLKFNLLACTKWLEWGENDQWSMKNDQWSMKNDQ